MADDVGDFAIDPDDLDEVVADMEHCESKLSGLTEKIEGDIAALHTIWEGLAATAQREAQEEWNDGMLAMRQSLKDLRAAARLAHTNYTGAAQANVDMWRQLS
jgi:WXG100 family type VII secretion target